MRVAGLCRAMLVSACLVGALLALGQAAGAEQPLVYTIVRGDTVPAVASRFGIPLDALLRAHGLALTDTLYAGDTLLLPLAPVAAEHVVAPGETIQDIAARYGVAPTQIAWRNGLADPHRLIAGRRLMIPDVTGEAPGVESAAVWPVAGQRVRGTLRVSGWAQACDNELRVELQAADGALVAQGSAAIHAEIGQLGAFALALPLPQDLAAGQMLLVSLLRRDGASGALERLDSIPVVVH